MRIIIGIISILAVAIWSFWLGFVSAKLEWHEDKQAMQHRIMQDSILILKMNGKVMEIKNNHIY